MLVHTSLVMNGIKVLSHPLLVPTTMELPHPRGECSFPGLPPGPGGAAENDRDMGL